MKIKIERIWIAFEPRDLWIGIYWDAPTNYLLIYVCIIPMFPIIVRLRKTYELEEIDEDAIEAIKGVDYQVVQAWKLIDDYMADAKRNEHNWTRAQATKVQDQLEDTRRKLKLMIEDIRKEGVQ